MGLWIVNVSMSIRSIRVVFGIVPAHGHASLAPSYHCLPDYVLLQTSFLCKLFSSLCSPILYVSSLVDCCNYSPIHSEWVLKKPSEALIEKTFPKSCFSSSISAAALSLFYLKTTVNILSRRPNRRQKKTNFDFISSAGKKIV